MLGTEDSVPGNIHHAVAHGSPDENADRRHDQHSLERCRPRPDGGIKKIDRVIAHTHRQVEDRQQKQKNNDAKKQYIHSFLS